MFDYDLIVIGVGPAGEKAAAQAAYFGKRVVAIERAADPGGAGTQTGTVPSKTLRETAMYLSGYRSREMYGVAVELEATATLPRLMSRSSPPRPSASATTSRATASPAWVESRASSTRTPSRS